MNFGIIMKDVVSADGASKMCGIVIIVWAKLTEYTHTCLPCYLKFEENTKDYRPGGTEDRTPEEQLQLDLVSWAEVEDQLEQDEQKEPKMEDPYWFWVQ